MAGLLGTRILITRPEPGATHTLNALHPRGIDAVCVPVFEIVPLIFDAPTRKHDALIVTSQNAIRIGEALLAKLVSIPVFAVGERSAEILRNLGFCNVSWAENASKLLVLITQFSPLSALYLCGKTRRPELEAGLAKAKIRVEIIEIYAAVPAINAAANLAAFFTPRQNFIVLFHAPSAAQAFVSVMQHQSIPESTRFLCMSAAIAAQLPEIWHQKVSIADHPDEEAMLNQLNKMLA